jgi:hypothetical protein
LPETPVETPAGEAGVVKDRLSLAESNGNHFIKVTYEGDSVDYVIETTTGVAPPKVKDVDLELILDVWDNMLSEKHAHYRAKHIQELRDKALGKTHGNGHCCK